VGAQGQHDRVYDLDQNQDKQDAVEQERGARGDRPGGPVEKSTIPAISGTTASAINTTPTATVTQSCTCSRTQIERVAAGAPCRPDEPSAGELVAGSADMAAGSAGSLPREAGIPVIVPPQRCLSSALDNIPAPAERGEHASLSRKRRHRDDERRLDHGRVAVSAFRAQPWTGCRRVLGHLPQGRDRAWRSISRVISLSEISLFP